ncbi:MAG: 23S rRNA pseudouridine(955/2504/2580) synthase RluC [Methylococcaceae bacterium]|nr:23S rRNA pseudouridine(955/2504/2580) synthase RluC [Methylococcaceae bacterium]
MNEHAGAAGKAQLLTISDDVAGQRVDNFLLTRLKGVPKSHIYRLLRTGQVRINGSRCQAQRRLDAGDVLRIPPVRTASQEDGSVPESLIRSRLDGRILFEDEDFLVLNKPAGLAVHGGTGLSFGVIEGLRTLRPTARFLELVHRLDRDTSGCLLVAKKRSALKSLHEMFRSDHQIDKTYVALLAGPWARKQTSIDAPLRKNMLQSGERMVRIAADGKAAQTDFRRLRKFAAATLVEARLLTGRTHQIRVHAQSMGHPIVGDDRYGSEAVNLEFRRLGLKRLFLHAKSLAFKHPRSGEPFVVEAPLEPELQAVLDQLASS